MVTAPGRARDLQLQRSLELLRQGCAVATRRTFLRASASHRGLGLGDWKWHLPSTSTFAMFSFVDHILSVGIFYPCFIMSYRIFSFPMMGLLQIVELYYMIDAWCVCFSRATGASLAFQFQSVSCIFKLCFSENIYRVFFSIGFLPSLT